MFNIYLMSRILVALFGMPGKIVSNNIVKQGGRLNGKDALGTVRGTETEIKLG